MSILLKLTTVVDIPLALVETTYLADAQPHSDGHWSDILDCTDNGPCSKSRLQLSLQRTCEARPTYNNKAHQMQDTPGYVEKQLL